MTLIRSNIFVMRISYTSEWDHILNSNSEDILLLMLLVIYIYIRNLCTQLWRKERKKKGASHVFPSSLPNHIWGLSSSFPSPFSSFIYIYIYIYIYTKEKNKKKRKKKNFALSCEGKGGGEKVHHTFFLHPFSTHLRALISFSSLLFYIYIFTYK